MVFDGINDERGASQIFQDGGHVGVQVGADAVVKEWFTVFRAENQMDAKAGEGLRHELGRPFRALTFVGTFSQGVALGWHGAHRWC